MGGRSSRSGINSGGGGYVSFSDTADSGWTYSGDGQDQIDFFMANSNFDELIKDMSPSTRE